MAMSGGLFASHGLNRFLFSALSCVMLSHSHLLQPFFSQPLSHISVSFCFSYLLCPPPGSARLFLSQMIFFPFLLLGLLFLPHSHYPTLFCSHFIFHLNTFSLYHSHTHAHTPLLLSQIKVVARLLLLLLLLPTTESIVSVIMYF